jgi:hypothetical protein
MTPDRRSEIRELRRLRLTLSADRRAPGHLVQRSPGARRTLRRLRRLTSIHDEVRSDSGDVRPERKRRRERHPAQVCAPRGLYGVEGMSEAAAPELGTDELRSLDRLREGSSQTAGETGTARPERARIRWLNHEV